MKLLVLCLLLVSCVSTKKQMDWYIGHYGVELIDRQGNPDRVESNGKGGEIWIYKRYKQAALTTGQTIAAYDYYIFYLDEAKIIYNWRTDRQPVPIQQLNVNLYIR